MTTSDRLDLLRRVVDEHGQAEVARRIGRSTAAVNQVLHGKYNGNPERILELIAAEFGSETVQCPVMGEIALARCTEERNKPFRATNPQRRRLYLACRDCDRRKS
jgi:transcriptional regulator with XRE-family HTH domain